MASKIALVFVIFTLVAICNAGIPHKRDTKETEVVSDAQQAIDKLFEDVSAGLKKLAQDGINLDGIQAKANELGEQVQKLGKELGEKVQEAAKKQGLTN